MDRFDVFMERCLYGDGYGAGGFYATMGSAGRSGGDFLTSPEVGPLFGAVIARALDGWWIEAGRPEAWTVYDAGCGPNTLLRAVDHAVGGFDGEPRPWRLAGVDRANPAADQAELPEDLSGSVVIANELLDNLPFRIVEQRESGLHELFVDDGLERWEPTAAAPPPGLSTNKRAPRLEQANAWIADMLARGAGHVIAFDYGEPTTAALVERGGWLRTYRKHERGDDPLSEPGAWDITTDIAADQLPPAATVERQHEFLSRNGIDDLVAEGKAYWHEHAARPNVAALRMRSRVSEAEALMARDGLGSWLVAQWRS